MRFSTIAAFMLPLTALAAPVQKSSNSGSDIVNQLNQLRLQIFQDVGTLNSSLIAVLDNGKKIQEGVKDKVVDDIVDTANRNLNNQFVALVDSGLKVIAAIEAGQTPNQQDQAVFGLSAFQIQADLARLQTNIFESIADEVIRQNTIVDINKKIVPNLASAKTAIDSIVLSGCTIIALQNISLQTLFNTIGADVGNFQCPPIPVN